MFKWLVDRTAGEILALDVELANTFWGRLRGLMFRRRFPHGRALLFKFRKPGRHSVHMFFVRFPIDLIYLNSDFKVVELRARLKPWRVYRPKTAVSHLVELPAGTIARSGVGIGHKISLEGKSFNP